MMPLFFLIFLVLAVRVALLPNAAEGYFFHVHPRWEALTDPMIWIWAMGQAFFSPVRHRQRHDRLRRVPLKDEDVVDVAQHTALLTPLPPWSRRWSSSPPASPTGWTSARARACCSSRCRPSCRISRSAASSPSFSSCDDLRGRQLAAEYVRGRRGIPDAQVPQAQPHGGAGDPVRGVPRLRHRHGDHRQMGPVDGPRLHLHHSPSARRSARSPGSM